MAWSSGLLQEKGYERGHLWSDFRGHFQMKGGTLMDTRVLRQLCDGLFSRL